MVGIFQTYFLRWKVAKSYNCTIVADSCSATIKFQSETWFAQLYLPNNEINSTFVDIRSHEFNFQTSFTYTAKWIEKALKCDKTLQDSFRVQAITVNQS